ncbi:ABC transporter ATP-binding protein [Mucilaginibacter sp. L3T2-6]|uniref:ABC transporter ATP-binding protein n=1 Tax=Mucilaginibacter sp. L3T2-6 TaxID=3062491 RepID=UPI002674AB35|nr:ABC transporter ATP-binding protein [Mucilaginibacter sp. L3T2-6]MDO3644564.1 ABC transporter ATP-binding protein [Mucilaginibacter sp. L3T2-6]MDV6217064.1 ABC transporter ATP-binding protein [Mucilaginibacter sp. L3T2-6]
MANTPFLQADSVSKVYPGMQASGVKKIDLSIVPGKITAIIGESGSGKSTLLKLLYGLLSPDSGKVSFKGDRIWGPEEKLIPGHDAMKMVTQQTDDLNLFAKVQENISIMLPSTDLKAKQLKTEQMLTQLKMKRIAEKKVAELSGGEKQRVAIARALVTGPEVLLLDEPFNQVDTSFREGLQRDIRQIVKETGLTVIIVSHDPAEVLSMADELIVLKDGEVLESGSPKELYQNPKYLYTAQLLTNCTVLTSDEARVCGLKTKSDHVVIYPEWIETVKTWTSNDWEVQQVLFKGCYEDLIMVYNGVTMRVLNDQFGKFNEGDKINLKLNKWLEY